MSRKPIIKAEVMAYNLAGDSARLAADIVRVADGSAGVYLESARKNIQCMRDMLNEIEVILETEEESNV